MRTTLTIAFAVVCAASPAAADEPTRGGIAVGVDRGERSAPHADGTSTLLSIGGELYGPRGSAVADIGVVADVTATLASDDMPPDVLLVNAAYGTPSWTGGRAAVRGRIHRPGGEAGLSLGVGSMEYSLVERDILTIIDRRADVYRYARAGVDGRLALGRAALFASLGGRAVFGGNTPSEVGFDAEAGLGVRVVGPLAVRASGMVEEFQYTAAMTTFRDTAWRARLALVAGW